MSDRATLRGRSLIVALVVACSLLFVRVALADDGSARLVFVLAEGSDARRGLEAVRAALPPGTTVADDAATRGVFESAQIELPLGARASTAQGRRALAAKLRRSLDARPGSVVIVVVSPASKTARRGAVALLIVGSGKAGVLADRTVEPSQKNEKLGAVLAKALAGVAEPTKNEPTPEPASGPPSTPEPTAAVSPPGKTGPATTGNTTTDPATPAEPGATASGIQNGYLVAELAVGTIGRHFSYRDQLTKNLRPYDLLAAPRVAAALEVYPAASTGVPVLRGLGLFGSFELAFGLSSKLPGGEALTTTYRRFQLGTKLRVPIGEGLVGIEVSYKGEQFTFGDASTPGAPIGPSVQYRVLHPGLFGRVPAGSFAVLLAAGFDGVLGIGGLEDAFPHARAAGVDGELGAAFPVSRLLELHVALRYERYFFALHPRPGDPYVAGGALDQLFGLQLGAALAP